jgi:hypothetical protein
VTAASRPSTACASALAGALALWLGGCGGGHHDGRKAVDSYLRTVNEVQQRSSKQFQQANQAYLRFSRGQLGPRVAVSDFVAAERAMQVTRDELTAVKPPAKAARLHRLLLRLYQVDQEFAHESTLLARYLPAQQRTLRPLAPAGRRLRRDLRGGGSSAQAAAFAGYAARLGKVVDRLSRLRAPPILTDLQSSEFRRLRAARGLAARLAIAVKGRDSQTVARLLLRFRKVSSQQAQTGLSAAAVAAYSKRYGGLTSAAADVQRERSRLDRTLH